MRRNGIKLILISIVASVLLLAAACGKSDDAGKSGDSLVFKFGNMASSTHAQQLYAMEPFNEEMAKVTDNRVTAQMYPGGSLSTPAETYDSVISGIQDISWSPASYAPGRFELHSVFNLPFLTQGTAEEVSVAIQKLYEQFPEIQDEYKEIKPLWFHGADEFVISTKGKAIRSLEDIKGLKLRSPGPEGRAAIEAWGAVPVTLSAPEAYDALQKGVVDGVVLPIAGLKDYNLYDVIDYVTHGNFVNSVFWAGMNENSWNKVSDEDQKAIEGIVGEPMARKAGAGFDKQAEEAIEEAEKAGIEFITLSESELQKFKDASKNVNEKWIADMEAKGKPGQEIYDAAYKLMHDN